MNQIIFGLKREYWEYRKLLIVMPLIVTGLFFLMTMAATWTQNFSDLELLGDKKGAQLEITTEQEKGDSSSVIDNKKSPLVSSNAADSVSEERLWFSGVYLAAAWLSAMFYALSSLFNDRRDNSILYWKTMPVSEVQTVIVKFLFAVLGFSIVAIGISWVSAVVLMSYAHLVLPAEYLANDTTGMSFSTLVVWPVIAVLVSLLWCAPVFSVLLYVSARVKKMPFLTLLVSVVVVRVIERIVFSSDYVFDFLVAHSPFGLISDFSEMNTVGEFLHTFLVDSFPSLVLGLLISAVLIWRTAWHRDNNFEI
jgi:ABC-2 type transport system permease protein